MIIADPARDPEQVGFALDEPAEADALYASADNVLARLSRLVRGSHSKNIVILSEEFAPEPIRSRRTLSP